jgi:hypothetical protein
VAKRDKPAKRKPAKKKKAAALKPETKPVMGRPSLRTPQVIDRILAGLRKGIPLTIVCSPKGMPDDNTVREWARADKKLSSDLACARDAGWDEIALEAKDIADDGTRDYKEVSDGKGSTHVVVDYDHIQRAKLRVDTRMKLLACWDKRYNASVVVKGSEEDPIVTKHKTDMTEAELLAIAATALRKVDERNG